MSLNVKYEHKLQDIAFLSGHHIQYIPHLHRELELICLLEGDVIAYADSVRYELHAGDIFLTFPNQIHSYEKVTEETHVYGSRLYRIYIHCRTASFAFNVKEEGF